MADINVNGRIKVSSFQQSFLKSFPYLVPTPNEITIGQASREEYK